MGQERHICHNPKEMGCDSGEEGRFPGTMPEASEFRLKNLLKSKWLWGMENVI